jgi:hypothetical protein
MIDVDKIEDIRKRARRGQPVATIARELHVSEPTVRKYRDMEDLSQGPELRREPQFPSLDGLTEKIDAWLEDDVRQWRKQRHTAVRVYVRLRDEEGYQGSYSTADERLGSVTPLRWRFAPNAGRGPTSVGSRLHIDSQYGTTPERRARPPRQGGGRVPMGVHVTLLSLKSPKGAPTAFRSHFRSHFRSQQKRPDAQGA